MYLVISLFLKKKKKKNFQGKHMADWLWSKLGGYISTVDHCTLCWIEIRMLLMQLTISFTKFFTFLTFFFIYSLWFKVTFFGSQFQPFIVIAHSTCTVDQIKNDLNYWSSQLIIIYIYTHNWTQIDRDQDSLNFL